MNTCNTIAHEKGLSDRIHKYITISKNLPHVHLLIGLIAKPSEDEYREYIVIMCDTGAGLNLLGNLQNHASCCTIAPNLVESYPHPNRGYVHCDGISRGGTPDRHCGSAAAV